MPLHHAQQVAIPAMHGNALDVDRVEPAAADRADFDFGADAHSFLTGAIGGPVAQAPRAEPEDLRQAEKAITQTLEHHAHVRIRNIA